MTKASDIDRELAALGVVASVFPEVDEVIAFRESLPTDLPAEEVKELVLAHARARGISLGGSPHALGGAAPPSLLDESLWDLLQQAIALLRAQHGELTAREALHRFSAFIGLDDALVGYVEQSASQGTPAPFPLNLHGTVFGVPSTPLGSVKYGPLVVLVATPFSDLEDLSRQLRDQAHETFKGFHAPRTKTLEELARIAELLKQRMSRKEITWQLLADQFPEIAAASDEERRRNYSAEYKRKRASLYRKFNRLEKNM